MAIAKGSARQRILQSAHALFYRRGIGAVSLDAIAEQAGVTKRTIYYHFESKDDLVASYVASRDQPNIDFYESCFERAPGSLPDKIEAMFTEIGRQSRGPRWQGCGFLRAAAELIDTPGHPALKAGARHKKRLEVWLASKLSDTFTPADAESLARQVSILLDGAFSVLLIHRDATYAEAAGKAAAILIKERALLRNEAV